MTFIYDWFDIAGKNNFEKFLMEFKGKSGLSFMEIGSFEGRSTLWLLENILTSPDSRITCVDTFEGSGYYKTDGISTENLEGRFRENVKNHLSKVTIRKGFSQNVVRGIIENFDFIYVDGSHTAYDTLEDMILTWRILKVGGIMIVDDYKWNRFQDPHLCPQLGIDAFISVFEGKYELLLKEYQVILRKL